MYFVKNNCQKLKCLLFSVKSLKFKLFNKQKIYLITMAQKDLIPIRTKDEAIRIGSMGGKKSGEARRKKRDLKQCFEIGLEFLTKKTSNEFKNAGNDKQAEIIAKIGVAAYSMLEIAVSKKANQQTKLKAWEAICDRVEGKPINKSIIDANVKSDITLLSDEEQDIIKKHIKKEADKLINLKK
jgi:hypothetical protein